MMEATRQATVQQQAMTGQAGPRMTMTYLHGRQRQVLLEQRKEKSMIWVADVHQRHY